MSKLPKIKKKLSGFLLSEEGEISKSALVGLGVALAGVGSALAGHNSNTQCNYDYNQAKIIAEHDSSHDSGGGTTSTTSTTTGGTTTTTSGGTTSTTSTTSTHTNSQCTTLTGHAGHRNCGEGSCSCNPIK
jgi:hypothetical protein